ncbi:hypothetical protein CXF83_11710 [Shewanella sp. Choline-02u-19]|uniref:hypothetical protein n=1 Tax=unclassified Shewanella TaxID=196818 RepID=UPI000C3496FC|nr:MULTISPECIES: hypothetical protein [unclassified Shewanella]PKH55897.1 hypothetical protein CXF84_15620 [Shewanella sp. Bg11-22]PKI27343.1 hypothetical protein CXF83_11710 [Shewanella sp. Choline-02u-19]
MLSKKIRKQGIVKLKIHAVTIEYSLGDLGSLQRGIETLTQDLDLESVETERRLYRDYRFIGVDEHGLSLGKPKVCKASFYSVLAKNDALRPLLVAYIKKMTAYNFFLGTSFALVTTGEAQIIKDPVYALADLGEQYIDLYCDAFGTSDRGYELGFDKPKRQFVRQCSESEQLAVLYAAMILGRLTVYSTEAVLPKPPASFVKRFADAAYCDDFIKLCAAEFIRNALIRRREKHHLELASLDVNKVVSDIFELEEQFTFQPEMILLLELTGRTANDILHGLKDEVIGIFDGSISPVKPVLFDFPTPQCVIEEYEK